ncbi:MAG: hypothetical protein J7524_23175, partial [Roseofilum sp. Belize BBD 4]|uniref:hypothetical protein n=1 Tax=Roseofilum sp. Belize BBD 4 TaxID=2821500 RepID=UPI001B10513A
MTPPTTTGLNSGIERYLRDEIKTETIDLEWGKAQQSGQLLMPPRSSPLTPAQQMVRDNYEQNILDRIQNESLLRESQDRFERLHYGDTLENLKKQGISPNEARGSLLEENRKYWDEYFRQNPIEHPENPESQIDKMVRENFEQAQQERSQRQKDRNRQWTAQEDILGNREKYTYDEPDILPTRGMPDRHHKDDFPIAKLKPDAVPKRPITPGVFADPPDTKLDLGLDLKNIIKNNPKNQKINKMLKGNALKGGNIKKILGRAIGRKAAKRLLKELGEFGAKKIGQAYLKAIPGINAASALLDTYDTVMLLKDLYDILKDADWGDQAAKETEDLIRELEKEIASLEDIQGVSGAIRNLENREKVSVEDMVNTLPEISPGTGVQREAQATIVSDKACVFLWMGIKGYRHITTSSWSGLWCTPTSDLFESEETLSYPFNRDPIVQFKFRGWAVIHARIYEAYQEYIQGIPYIRDMASFRRAMRERKKTLTETLEQWQEVTKEWLKEHPQNSAQRRGYKGNSHQVHPNPEMKPVTLRGYDEFTPIIDIITGTQAPPFPYPRIKLNPNPRIKLNPKRRRRRVDCCDVLGDQLDENRRLLRMIVRATAADKFVRGVKLPSSPFLDDGDPDLVGLIGNIPQIKYS